jgi:hypothetical protein
MKARRLRLQRYTALAPDMPYSPIDSRKHWGEYLIAPCSVGTASTVGPRPVCSMLAGAFYCPRDLNVVCPLADAATSP